MKLTNLCESSGRSVKDLRLGQFGDQYPRDLSISACQLATLEGCPERVNGNVILDFNNLKSLRYGPSWVKGYFTCKYNALTTLEFCPVVVGTGFICAENKLTSLLGVQKTIHGIFDCSKNKLLSLEHGPIRVEGQYECSDNKLTSLNGIARFIGDSLSCYSNKLSSLVGIDDLIDEIHGYVDFELNPIHEGGLGLILIKGITSILTTLNDESENLGKAMQIISRYTNKPGQIYNCQNELIDNNLDRFAQI